MRASAAWTSVQKWTLAPRSSSSKKCLSRQAHTATASLYAVYFAQNFDEAIGEGFCGPGTPVDLKVICMHCTRIERLIIVGHIFTPGIQIRSSGYDRQPHESLVSICLVGANLMSPSGARAIKFLSPAFSDQRLG
jgi:hypothetical protein